MRRFERQMHDKIVQLFESHGVDEYSFDHSARHIRVRFKVGRTPRLYFMASTPSDHRTEKNVISTIRNIIRAGDPALSGK